MRDPKRLTTALVLALAGLLSVLPARQATAGKVEGRVSVNGKAAPLAYAGATTAENLFDEKKRDVVILLADRSLPAEISPGDEVGVSLLARKGDLRAILVRIDAGKKLVNVKLFDKGIEGMVIFPAKDFEFQPGKIDDKSAAGKLRTRAPTTFEGTTIECEATFDAPITVAPAEAEAAPEPPPAGPDRGEALNRLLVKGLTFTASDFLTAVSAQELDKVKLYLDAGMSPDTPGGPGTVLPAAKTPLVWAIMMRNEPMALALIHAGADARRKDADGFTPLTWAVESCEVPVVQALIDAKADVNHKRAGMTMLREAGACPEAAALLRKAGAK